MSEETKELAWQDDVACFLVFPKPEFRKRLRNLWEQFSLNNFRDDNLEIKQMFAKVLGCHYTDIFHLLYCVDNISQPTFETIWKNMNGLEKILNTTLGLIKRDYLLKWLITPNEIFQKKMPRELLATKEGVDTLLQVVHLLESELTSSLTTT